MEAKQGYVWVPAYEPVVNADTGRADPAQKGEEHFQYAVKGRPAFAFVDLFLKRGQKVIADAGAMLWMDGNVPIETGCFGGCCSSFARTCAGESCCFNKFSHPGHDDNHVRVSFGFDLPGDMLPFAVEKGKGWVLTRKAFIVGTENVVVSARFAGCAACLCSGEGPFLTKVTSDEKGLFFAGSYGALERHEIQEKQVLFVDPGLFFAAKADIKIGIGLAGGIKTCCFGGEAFVMKFTGPCVVYTKSRDPRIFDEGSADGQQGPDKKEGAAGAAGAAAGAAAR